MPDADRWLDLVGVGLAVAILVGLVVVGLSFANAGGDSDGDGAPDASWSFDRVDDTHVRVTHAGGEPVRTENLLVTVNSLRRVTNWSDPVAEGDHATVEASNGALVRVVWTGGRGDRVVMAAQRL